METMTIFRKYLDEKDAPYILAETGKCSYDLVNYTNGGVVPVIVVE